MADLTDHVADALFNHDAVVNTATGHYGLAMSDCDQLAAAALQAARAQGWRIVKPSHDDPHHVTFTDDGWAIEHSAACRNAGSMLDCQIDRLVRAHYDDGPPIGGLGRYRAHAERTALRLDPAPATPTTTALLYTDEWVG